MDNAEIDEKWEVMKSEIRDLRSKSDLSAGLVGKQVINALQLTYRKHCLADDSIGWIELEDILRDALCEAMGDREFCLWLNDVAD